VYTINYAKFYRSRVREFGFCGGEGVSIELGQTLVDAVFTWGYVRHYHSAVCDCHSPVIVCTC